MTENPIIPNTTIETIDTAFFRFMDETLNLHCNSADGWKKVPIIWASAERAFQVKDKKELRDEFGTLILPIISVERTSISKDVKNKGTYQANLAPKDNRIFIAKQLNQDKTENFANADSLRKNSQINFVTSKKNKKQVYEFISIPIPVYVTVEYKVSLLTSYVTQMNELLQPVMTRSAALNYFTIDAGNTRFECFIDPEYTHNSIAELDENERKYKTDIKIKVLGHLIGDGENQDKPQEIRLENAVDVKSPRESLFLIEDEGKKLKPLPVPTNYGKVQASGVAFKQVYLIGDGINSLYTINHGLNTKDMYIAVRENFSGYDRIEAGIGFQDSNNIIIDMGDIIPNDSYAVIIIG